MNYKYRPVLFFGTTYLITWICWSGTALLSHLGIRPVLGGVLMLIGLLSPCMVAITLMGLSKNKLLLQDFKERLLNFRLIQFRFLPIIFFFLPLVMVISIYISVFFGFSLNQLQLTSNFDIMKGQPWISLLIPIIAPALEELGWSGYGIDSLKSRFKLFYGTLLFGILWSIWHLPLFFVKGYYHYQLMDQSIFLVLNFFLSVLPLTFLTNWIYYWNGRSIIAAILFHIVVVVSSEVFMVDNWTKCIVTILITMVAFIVVWKERKRFFGEVEEQKSPTITSYE